MSRTSIPVDTETKERLDQLKRGNETWDEFLTRMASEQEPIRQGDLSDEALEAIEDNISKSREQF